MNYTEAEEGRKKINKQYPQRILLGYSFNESNKKFVKVWYKAFQAIDFEPCSMEEVNFNRFIHPSAANWLEDCTRDEQTAYFRAIGFSEEFIQNLEYFDLRCAANYILDLCDNMNDLNPVTYIWLRDILQILKDYIEIHFPT